MIFADAPHRIIMIGGMTDISTVCSEQECIFVRIAVHRLLW
jgi:galactokinase/mevalonate kinase-like predicted kinase